MQITPRWFQQRQFRVRGVKPLGSLRQSRIDESILFLWRIHAFLLPMSIPDPQHAAEFENLQKSRTISIRIGWICTI
jgi:hypothetical protein